VDVGGRVVDPDGFSSPESDPSSVVVPIVDGVVESIIDSDTVDGPSVDPSSVVPLGLTVVEPEPSGSSEEGVTIDVDPETSVLVSAEVFDPVVDSKPEEVVDPSSVVPLGLTVVEPEPSCSSEDGVTDDVDPEISVLDSVEAIASVVDSEFEEVVVSVDEPSLPEMPSVDSDDVAVVVGETVDSVVIPDPGWMVEDESPPSEDILSASSSGLLDWPLSKDPCNPMISLSH